MFDETISSPCLSEREQLVMARMKLRCEKREREMVANLKTDMKMAFREYRLSLHPNDNVMPTKVDKENFEEWYTQNNKI